MPTPSRDPLLRGSNDLGLAADPNLDRRISRRPRSGVMVVALMAVVAVVGLYSMRNIGAASASSGISREIEQLVASVLPSKPIGDGGSASAPAIVEVDDAALFAMLDTEFRSALQVPFADLGRDPFEPWRDPAAAVAPTGPAVSVDARVQQGQMWNAEIDRIAGMLVVKSVIGGGTPSAMANINGRILRPGDRFTVAEAEADFRVIEIERDGVVLRARHPRLGIERDATARVPRPF
ncbi:MAG: hypothetical protein ACO38V_00915 [Phycisphaerales bacterium]